MAATEGVLHNKFGDDFHCKLGIAPRVSHEFINSLLTTLTTPR